MSSKRRVQVGDEIEMLLAKTDTCHHMQVAGHVLTVRIMDGHVKIRNASPYPRLGTVVQDENGVEWLRNEPTFAEAGVYVDEDGPWVDPLPDRLVQVYRAGEPVSPRMVDDGIAYAAWLHRRVPYSADHAIAYEGYAVKVIDDVNQEGGAQ